MDDKTGKKMIEKEQLKMVDFGKLENKLCKEEMKERHFRQRWMH